MTAKTTTPIDPHDALTLALERADSLTGLLEQRLSDLNDRPGAPSELYALSLVAAAVSDQHQVILDQALALHEIRVKRAKTGWTR